MDRCRKDFIVAAARLGGIHLEERGYDEPARGDGAENAGELQSLYAMNNPS